MKNLTNHLWAKIRVALRFHGKGTFPNFPIPMRLPYGAWWLAWNDVTGKAVLKGVFDVPESEFLARFLQPGMTVLDIGAHHGFYTMLASRRVGNSGRVLAFEPSPRERRKLRWHLRLNKCLNVEVLEVALGNHSGTAEFFLAAGRETGCNSLEPPAVRGGPKKVMVPIETLDGFLARRGIGRVDFLKMDIEGAELSALEGAEKLLGQRPRPVMLMEVSDLRTAAWGYPASRILKHLVQRGFQWFRPQPGGFLHSASLAEERYDGNFIAVPDERLNFLQELLQSSLHREKEHEALSPPWRPR